MGDTIGYPQGASARNRWVQSLRGPKNRLNPWRPYAWLWEKEWGEGGQTLPTATLFLTNKECPFRCLMCDLWRNTLDTPVPEGAIPEQIAWALQQLPSALQIKLYNAGSFFDPQAIPPVDYAPIASLLAPFERVIVESHPRFLGERCLRLQGMLAGQLEVAMGLETAHPAVLDRLNKRMTVETFRKAARFLAKNGISLRVFVLVRPPFLSEEEGVEWAIRSMEVAFAEGARVCTLIPTRGGNGAMEALAEGGLYAPPSLLSLERVQRAGLSLEPRGCVYVDLWDIHRFAHCVCSSQRIAQLKRMNCEQRPLEPIACPLCDAKEGC